MAKVSELKKNTLQPRDIVKAGKGTLVSTITFFAIWAIETYIVKQELHTEARAFIAVVVGLIIARFTDGNKVVVDVENQTQAKQVAQAVRREV